MFYKPNFFLLETNCLSRMRRDGISRHFIHLNLNIFSYTLSHTHTNTHTHTQFSPPETKYARIKLLCKKSINDFFEAKRLEFQKGMKRRRKKCGKS